MNEEIVPGIEEYLTTTVALITTSGPYGVNVMAAEWAMQVSYDPFLIVVSVGPEEATHEQIAESREFGANFCSHEQYALVALAGTYSRREVDKLTSELFETYPATYIRAPLVRGCVVNAECVLEAEHSAGDHTLFVGRVLAASFDPDVRPMIRHRRRLHELGPAIDRPQVSAVTVTPGEAKPGERVKVAGRAILPSEEREALLVLFDNGGKARFQGVLVLADGRLFDGELDLPDDLPPGVHQLVAEVGSQRGAAKIRVTS